MSGVANPRAVVTKRDRRNNRCPHKFINQGKGLCWVCDPSVAAQDKNGITGSMRRTR